MKNSEAPIVKRTYDLVASIFAQAQHVPRFQRYTLWQRITTLTTELLEIFINTAYAPLEQRALKLDRANSRVDTIRMLVRLAYETKAISSSKYLEIQGIIDEIGRMVGGWMRHLGR